MLLRLFLICVFAFSCVAADVTHVGNFGVVGEHLMRGAEPSSTGIKALSEAGVKLVIDLRETGAGTELEKQLAQKAGMKYINIPFPPLSAPKPEQVQMVLRLIEQNHSQTVFVHCRRGKDRTGTVIACYRVQHDGWDNQRALEEAKSFGMSSAERGMRSFILHFTPALGGPTSLPL
jgi:protein tyrosine/serine phosphatase